MPPTDSEHSSDDEKPEQKNHEVHHHAAEHGFLHNSNHPKHLDESIPVGKEISGVSTPMAPVAMSPLLSDSDQELNAHKSLGLSMPKEHLESRQPVPLSHEEPIKPPEPEPSTLSPTTATVSSASSPHIIASSPLPASPPVSATPPVTAPAAESLQPKPDAFTALQPKKDKKRWLKKLLLPVLIILVLAGGSAAAYFGYFVPNQPKNIVQTALINMVSGNKFSSLSFNAAASIYDVSSKQTFSASLTGSEANGGKIDATLSVDAIVANITLQLLSADGQNYYIKVGGLDGLSQLLKSDGLSSQLSGLVNSLNNQWYEINQSLLTQIENSVGSSGSTSTNVSLTQADINKLTNLYKQNSFLTVQKTLPSQVIAGMDSDGFQVVINKTKLQAFVSAVSNAHIQGLGISQTLFTDFNNYIKTGNTSKYPFDIWISKSNYLIDQLSWYSSASGSPYNLKLTLSNFNEPVNIQVPNGAKSMLDLISQFTQDLGLGSNSSSLNPLELLNGGTTSITQSL